VTHLQTSAVGLLLLFAFETLHLVLATPEFLSLLGSALGQVVLWYAALWLVSSLAAVALFPDSRRRTLTTAVLLYLVVSTKIFAQETTLLWRPLPIGAFLAASLVLWTAVYLLSRRLRSDVVLWAALLVYWNLVRLMKRAWSSHPAELSTTELVVYAVVSGFISITAVIGFPLLLRSRRVRLYSVSALGTVLCLATLAWSRPVKTSEHRRAGAAPDIYVVSLDALRKDVLARMCDESPDDALGRLCRTSTSYENVVADGISTYQVLGRNLRTNTGCDGSVPAFFARQGYTTSMYLGRKRKRLDGAACFANYYAGEATAYVDAYAAPSIGRRIVTGDASIVMNKVVPSEEMLARFEADTSASAAPVFAYLHLLDLHTPYGGAADHPDDPHWPAVRTFVSKCYERRCDPALIARMKAAYERSLPGVRRHLDEVVKVAERRRRPYKLILTSDHGELFGEHGGVMHSNGFVPELLAIPFLVFDSTGSRVRTTECPLMLSSTALSKVLGVPVGASAPGDAVVVEGTPLGHAVISAERSVLEYFIAPRMLRLLDTPRNVHKAPRGTLRWPNSCDP